MKERVQKLMAQANIGSRRASEEIIRQGRVRVNGTVISLGDKADPTSDTIHVDGQQLVFDTKRLYVAFHKPINVLSTNTTHAKDDRSTAVELLPYDEHLFTVGRLDAESTGLLVLTNDGDLANKLTHPRYEHTKTYRVIVYGLPDETALEKWRKGITLDDGDTAACYVSIEKGTPKLTTLKIVMTEGKNRQIRRVASLLGYPVHKLTRTHIGMFSLGRLRPGEYKELTDDEIKLMQTPSPELKLIKSARSKNRNKNKTYQRRKNK